MKTFKDLGDVLDELENIKMQLCFMGEASSVMTDQPGGMGGRNSFGMVLLFKGIEAQIENVSDALKSLKNFELIAMKDRA